MNIISGDQIVFGDNFYSINSSSQPIPGLEFKEAVDCTFGTLGLSFKWTVSGRLQVYHNHSPYAMGVQRSIDNFYGDKNNKL